MAQNLERLKKLAGDGLLPEQDRKLFHREQARKGVSTTSKGVTPFRVRNEKITQVLLEQGFRDINQSWGTFPKCRRTTEKGKPLGCSDKDRNGGCALASCRKRFQFTALLPPFGMSKEQARKIVDKLIRGFSHKG